MALAPAACIAVVTLAFTFLGDGLRDALRSKDADLGNTHGLGVRLFSKTAIPMISLVQRWPPRINRLGYDLRRLTWAPSGR